MGGRRGRERELHVGKHYEVISVAESKASGIRHSGKERHKGVIKGVAVPLREQRYIDGGKVRAWKERTDKHTTR